MKEIIFKGVPLKGSGQLVLREKDALGEILEEPLVTAAEVRRRLKCSLRQVYRYIFQERLKPAGKFMGRWVFRKKDMELFHAPRRGLGARLPAFLKPIFWSYRLKDIDPSAHACSVVTQVLEHGNIKAVRWACRYYGLDYVLRVAGNCRGLSAPTKSFWSLLKQYGST